MAIDNVVEGRRHRCSRSRPLLARMPLRPSEEDEVEVRLVDEVEMVEEEIGAVLSVGEAGCGRSSFGDVGGLHDMSLVY